MTELRSMRLDELLPGMQHAVFELIWDAFPWIKSIWIKANKDRFYIFVEATARQDEKEWDDLDYLVRNLLEGVEKLLDELTPNSQHKIKHTIQHGRSVPRDDGYRELMSDRVFKKIAKRIAPWRLENGR